MTAPLTSAAKPRASRRPLYFIALVCLAPIVASFALYFWMPSMRQVNYGTLLEPKPLPQLALAAADGSAGVSLSEFRGKWLLLTVDAAPCAEACAARLYATRQARTMQGKERERVTRLLVLAGDGAPSAELRAAHPDLRVARADPALLAALPPPEGGAIFLVDPLGNLVLRYPGDPDIKRLHKDIARLLYASQIG